MSQGTLTARTSDGKASRTVFLESLDDETAAYERAFEYGDMVMTNPLYRGWLVTVRKMRTSAGMAYGIFVINERDAA